MPDDPDTPQSEQSPERPEQGERLQKFLAHAGVASRRQAEALIVAGAVRVNGEVVRELGTRVHPEADAVTVRGRPVAPPRPLAEALYIAMNKPADVVTTSRDPQYRRTVLDLLPAAWRARRVYPVGRLDRGTEGLLLLTDDGELALRLTHPRYALPKEYEALVLGQPPRAALNRLERGMFLEGETRATAPARAWPIRTQPDGNAWVGLELHEGRKRQARRMLQEVGYPTLRLIRVRVGPVMLGNLAPGATRQLTPTEVAALRDAVGLGGDGPHPLPPLP